MVVVGQMEHRKFQKLLLLFYHHYLEMNMVGPNATQNLQPLTSIVCGVGIFLEWSTQTTGFTDWSDS